MNIPDGLLKINHCDAAIIGVGVRCAQDDILVYDYHKLIKCFVDDGMTPEEAEEWIDYNITGAWLGENTPMVVYPLSNEV